MPFHRALQKLQRRLAIPTLRSKDLEHFAFVIDGAPKIMRLAIDPHEHLVQVPTPGRVETVIDASRLGLSREHWSEPVPPETHRFVTDIDTTLEQ